MPEPRTMKKREDWIMEAGIAGLGKATGDGTEQGKVEDRGPSWGSDGDRIQHLGEILMPIPVLEWSRSGH